jgi:hypothetical protein
MHGKPVGVVARKAAQYAKLGIDHHLGLWKRRERAAERRWTEPAIARLLAGGTEHNGWLINAKGIAAGREFLDEHPDHRDELNVFRDRIVNRKVPVFASTFEMPDWDQLPWCEDWRFGHRWPSAFYRDYNFYEFDKPTAYDVKFPWELSRLNFLMIPTLLAVLDGDSGSPQLQPPQTDWWQTLQRILASWRRDNPTANSVNWYPMECAMRSVNLVMLLSLLAHAEPVNAWLVRQCLFLAELHGRFLYDTVEYGDVRGNHFATEVVALVLLGLLFTGHVPQASRWLDFGRRHLQREVLLQYSEDGVQFEKSMSYHRLVTELFMVATIALDQRGIPVEHSVHRRLRRACQYIRAYVRPDGLAPVWGDSDDARAIWFEERDHRDHRGLLTLAAAYFEDDSLAQDVATVCINAPLLLGSGSPPDRTSLSGHRPRAEPEKENKSYFPDGGMVCATSGRCHFVADVGSVGLHGRGGHGHLDALSFELTLDGIPLIVDPGSYVYTGDPAARNHFRSTRAHNVVMIDEQEMASLFPTSLWRLGSESDPYEVRWNESHDGFVLTARHDGYARLTDAVGYQREWEFSKEESSLRVSDRLQVAAPHNVRRYLHFNPGLNLRLRDQGVEIAATTGQRYLLCWHDGAEARLVDDWVSQSYGSKTKSITLELANSIQHDCNLEFDVRPCQPN